MTEVLRSRVSGYLSGAFETKSRSSSKLDFPKAAPQSNGKHSGADSLLRKKSLTPIDTKSLSRKKSSAAESLNGLPRSRANTREALGDGTNSTRLSSLGIFSKQQQQRSRKQSVFTKEEEKSIRQVAMQNTANSSDNAADLRKNSDLSRSPFQRMLSSGSLSRTSSLRSVFGGSAPQEERKSNEEMSVSSPTSVNFRFSFKKQKTVAANPSMNSSISSSSADVQMENMYSSKKESEHFEFVSPFLQPSGFSLFIFSESNAPPTSSVAEDEE